MNFKNHPLGMPQTYAEKLVQRHSDLGFIMAQLNREYGQHGLTRDDIAKLRKRFPEGFSGEAAEARADVVGLGHRES